MIEAITVCDCMYFLRLLNIVSHKLHFKEDMRSLSLVKVAEQQPVSRLLTTLFCDLLQLAVPDQ